MWRENSLLNIKMPVPALIFSFLVRHNSDERLTGLSDLEGLGKVLLQSTPIFRYFKNYKYNY